MGPRLPHIKGMALYSSTGSSGRAREIIENGAIRAVIAVKACHKFGQGG